MEAGRPGSKRSNWDGLLPVPGDGRYEWDWFLDADELPVEFNPPRGWVASANEMTCPKAIPTRRRKSVSNGTPRIATSG